MTYTGISVREVCRQEMNGETRRSGCESLGFEVRLIGPEGQSRQEQLEVRRNDRKLTGFSPPLEA